jgi:hypothetical protein
MPGGVVTDAVDAGLCGLSALLGGVGASVGQLRLNVAPHGLDGWGLVRSRETFDHQYTALERM